MDTKLESAIADYIKEETNVTFKSYAETKAFMVLPTREEDILASLPYGQGMERKKLKDNQGKS
ncbi:MAG: hypothetical protein U1E36_02015 [Rickettsiales bacterium]